MKVNLLKQKKFYDQNLSLFALFPFIPNSLPWKKTHIPNFGNNRLQQITSFNTNNLINEPINRSQDLLSLSPLSLC